MSSPLIGIGFFVLAFVGLVLLLQGATGRDRDLLGSGFAIPALFGRHPRDQEQVDAMHPPEPHPRRLVVIGAGLLVLAVLGVIVWGVLL